MASYGSNRIATGESDLISIPRDPLRNARPVFVLHGYGGLTASPWLDPTNFPGTFSIIPLLTGAGLTCIGGDWGGTSTWGVDVVVTRFDQAMTLAATIPGLRTDKAVLVTESMGNDNACRIAKERPTQVAGICSIIPVCDPQDIYANDRTSLRAPIATALGITYPTPVPDVYNPAKNAAVVAPVCPIRLYYSTVDTTVIPSTVTAYRDALVAAGGDAQAIAIDSTYGHDDRTVQEAITYTSGLPGTIDIVQFCVARALAP